jgi:hypothetical protein
MKKTATIATVFALILMILSSETMIRSSVFSQIIQNELTEEIELTNTRELSYFVSQASKRNGNRYKYNKTINSFVAPRQAKKVISQFIVFKNSISIRHCTFLI